MDTTTTDLFQFRSEIGNCAQFQINPDFYPSRKECEEVKAVNTNPRYKHFQQTHFTAGDEEQFEKYRDKTNGSYILPNLTDDFHFWEKYAHLTPLSVNNTFAYLFHKFKKGLFIKIKNGQLSAFLPFSNKNYVNDWADKIKVDPVYRNINGFIEHIHKMENRRFYPNTVNKYFENWYCNNCLVRCEFPIHEGDTNTPIISDLLRTLCKERQLPDMEFFINKRDFPILKTDSTEPYEHMWDSDIMPLRSHNYDTYAPILGMVTSTNFADIPMPTGDDWSRVCRSEGKFFPQTCDRSYQMKSELSWRERKPIAVFRGASTGPGVTIDTNPRLKLAFLSKTLPKEADGLQLLDAGITSWNLRPRKLKGQKFLRTIEIASLPFKLVSPLSPNEQAGYKYLINVDGHVCAYRLSLELGSGSCVLLQESKYKLWYSSLLKPYTHFVPIKSDLSDIIQQIRWCKEHDTECEQIAKNAKEFFDKYLNREAILDYMQSLLIALKKHNGFYVYNAVQLPFLIQEDEKRLMNNKTRRKSEKIEKIYTLPPYERGYQLLTGIQVALNGLTDLQNLPNEGILFQNQNTCLQRRKIADFPILEKSSVNLTHEAFVGKVLNSLLRSIPNFRFTFGLYDSKLLCEFIQGETLLSYIQGPNFTLPDFISILLQICLSLQIAQRQYYFVHNDLTPWNIILQKGPQREVFYTIEGISYRFFTSLVPIIIDFGRSHIIFENRHWGSTINPFSFSSIQDIVSLLVTSLYEISERNANDAVLTLGNFLCKKGYHDSLFRNIGEMKSFLRKAKKYAVLVGEPKGELERCNPLHLVHYIAEHLKNICTMRAVNANMVNTFLLQGHAEQVYYYLTTDDDEKKLQSFFKVFDSVDEYSKEEALTSLYEMATKLYPNRKEEIDIQYNKAISKFAELERIEIKEGQEKWGDRYGLTEETFLFPKRIKAILDRESGKGADYRTVKFYAKRVYKENLKEIEKERKKEELPKEIKEYKEVCESIIELIF